MHAILTSIGTDGDIVPYVGLGAELRRRGHRVTVAVAEPWQKRVEELDLEFSPIVSNEEDALMLEDPDFWHPLKGPTVVAKWGRQFVSRQYAQLTALCDSPDALLVANCGLLAARVVNEKRGVPLASLILQPWMIKSSVAAPVMPAGLTLPRWAPRIVARGYWRMFNFVGDLLVGKSLNQLRESLGLAPVSQVFEWWLSEELVIGMFPDWYGPPQADWIHHLKLAGFPLFDGRANAELSDDLKRFCDEGAPPVAFTFGTGMIHGERLFKAAVDACEKINRRGILLTRHMAQIPKNLPRSILVCPYAPFSQLFPRCGAIVHHGGIGTTAKALASGVPQVITPLAFDQSDNAARLKRLGVSDFIRASRATGKSLAAMLQTLMSGPTKQRSEETAKRFVGVNSLALAADWVEELSASRTKVPA